MEKSISTRAHKIIAEMLYQLRVAAGIRQEALAQMLGAHQSFVSKIESGERRLDLVELRAVLTCLNASLIDFATEFEKRIAKP